MSMPSRTNLIDSTKEANDIHPSCQLGNAARPRTGESLMNVTGPAHASIPDPRPRQLRDAQQSCRYPTREYQLDRPSLKMAPPRSLSGSSTAIRSPRRGQNQLVSVDKESHINVRHERQPKACLGLSAP